MTNALDDTAAESPGAMARGLARDAAVGKYRLDRELGAGGMGVVWAARDPDLDRDVALKLLRPGTADPELRTRLLREARAMARLKHPNVLTVYEVGSDGDRDFIAMELIDGGSLDAWLATRPPRREVLAALLAAGRGLSAAHDAGLVHRDFKPHNVLRSRGGDVLVTDFGLARGVAEEGVAVEVVAPPSGRRSDPVLDSTLTQTGAMIGTPAYMAPEQFEGAAPDPRTDQFAFCVTAWQALTGERPYAGATLEELRRAIAAGDRAPGARLSRAVRRVLIRGLAADPARRWPDMNVLMRELARAAARPRRLAIGGGLALAIAGIAAFAVLQPRRYDESRAVDARAECDAGDAAFDPAWSDKTRAMLVGRLTSGGYESAVPRWLDGLRARWLATYRQTCAKPAEPSFHARLGCLLGARDSVGSLVDMLQLLPIHQLGAFDVFGVAPQLAACTGVSPPTPPAMPQDRATRDKIAALRARTFALHDQPAATLEASIKQLEGEARALAWQPLVAQLLYGAGVAAHRLEQWPLAQDLMQRAAIEAAASRDPTTEAQARIDRYEIAIDVAENPRDAFELERLGKEARAAIRGAGDDPVMRAALDVMEARVAVLQHAPERTLQAPTAARDAFLAAGDTGRAAFATHLMVLAYLERDRAGDVDAAAALVTDTRKKLAGPSSPRTEMRLRNAEELLSWRRGDVDDYHTTARAGTLAEPDKGVLPFEVTVLGPDGKPASGVTVVAWQGSLIGDSAGDVRGATMMYETGDEGRAELHASGAVIAQKGDLRSVPRIVTGPTELHLRPTSFLTGRIVGELPAALQRTAPAARIATTGVDACVEIALAPATLWLERGPARADGTFRLARVPDTAALACATDGVRVVRAVNGVIHWPAAAPLDVIVRGATGTPQVWVFRGRVSPRTRAEAEALASKALDIATSRALVIGQGEATAAGREQYRPGDLHVVIEGTARGTVTACVARDDTPAAKVECNHHEMKIEAIKETLEAPASGPEIRHVVGVAEAIVIAADFR